MLTVSQPPPLPGFGLSLQFTPCARTVVEKLNGSKFGWPLNFAPGAQTVVEKRDGSEEEIIEARGEGKPLFQSALDHEILGGLEDRLPPLTLREIAMLEFMNTITDKPGWESKIFDESITDKWKAEVLGIWATKFTPAMADYCIDELKYKAELYQKTGAVSVFHGDVVKADHCIPFDLKNALRAAVAVLEDTPDQRKDWHPGSNETVLDLVHPSLYPLTYGLTRILPDSVVDLENCITKSGHGETVPVPPEVETICTYLSRWSDVDRKLYSNKFQWLPCDVDISGETPRIVSYINNLHPQWNASLYSVVENIIDKIIPLWNLTLSPLRDFVYQCRIPDGDAPVSVEYPGLEEYVEEHGPKREDGEDADDFMRHEGDFIAAAKARFILIPDAGVFTKPEPLANPVNLKADYGHRGIQVIVKLANIHLTPEKPEYGGGVWHVEGQLNEYICASAIYYFDNENTTPSRLAFRQAANAAEIEVADYEKLDTVWLEEIFGCRNEEPPIQQVGSIETREDRVITFPNLLQHQVQPFELVDPTRPGHRKILALFLVDPHIRIISTANVPCQRRDWWSQAISNDVNSRLAELPPEIREKIIDEVEDFPISLETAKRLREELMEERKSFMLLQDENFRWVEISLCEH